MMMFLYGVQPADQPTTFHMPYVVSTAKFFFYSDCNDDINNIQNHNDIIKVILIIMMTMILAIMIVMTISALMKVPFFLVV